MANMTRDELVTELQARGWNRYTAAQLQKYLDWALQEVYRRGQFPSFQPDTSAGAFNPVGGATLGLLTLVGGSDGRFAVSVDKVTFYNSAGAARPLMAADATFFEEVIHPNALTPTASGRIIGFPEYYYLYDEFLYFYPVPDVTYNYSIVSKERTDSFGSGSATTAPLPERFDPAVLAFAEMICNRRARDYDAMAIAESIGQTIIDSEIAATSRVNAREPLRFMEGYNG